MGDGKPKRLDVNTVKAQDPENYIALTNLYATWLETLDDRNKINLSTPPGHYAFLHANPKSFNQARVAFQVWVAFRRLTG